MENPEGIERIIRESKEKEEAAALATA